MQTADFWQNQLAGQKVLTEYHLLKKELEPWETLDNILGTFRQLSKEQQATKLQAAEKLLAVLRQNLLMTGSYDRGPAILEIFSGAGGVDAQDWASLLFRMYSRYAEKRNWQFNVLHQSLGEQSGVKSVMVEIRGPNAYGYLKREGGVHRLVRISPFSAKNLRHTSFALVEVVPLVEGEENLKIKPEDLKIETFRSSGPGGQNVNKLETAVRITHLSSGLTVAVQSERSQGQNKEKALAVLFSRLKKQMAEQKVEELAQLKALKTPGGIEWGSQIRSYVLHPYKLVKDHRTGHESAEPEKILDGELEEFIEAESSLPNRTL